MGLNSYSFQSGEIGLGFIEAHHVFPISQLTEETDTKIEDLALVCSNCHRMLHRKRLWLTIEKLKEIRSWSKECMGTADNISMANSN